MSWFHLPLVLALTVPAVSPQAHAPLAVGAAEGAPAAILARDPHSLGNPDVVRPVHVSLDLTLRFERKVIEGRASLSLHYGRPRSARYLDLDTRGLVIQSVTTAEGRALPYVLQPELPRLGRRLRITLGALRPARVTIVYETSPGATALQWLEPRQTTSGKLPFLFTQSQAIHARSWIPLVDSPGARVSYDASVRVPPGMVAVMSASHLEHDPAQGVFRFELRQPIPPYLIALAAGEIEFRALGRRTGVYAEPAVVERAAWEFADMEKMLVAAERLIGPYAWGRWDAIVLPPSFPYGGMENPRLTFATPTLIAGDRSLTSVMAHELAHSWSGNLVTNATWGDIWLNEGLTTYLENRIDEALYGAELARMQQLLGQRELREEVERLMKKKAAATRLAQDIAKGDPDDASGTMAYEKGANFLHMLEHHFGRERFDAFLQRYFAAHAFQSITSTRFLDLLRRELFAGDSAAWTRLHVEAWVHGTGLPDNLVVPASNRFEITRAAAAAFATSGALDGVRADWHTAEWLDFLGALPRSLPRARLDALDGAHHLSAAGNAEVLSAWLRLAVANSYEPAYPSVESFLARQGRAKFVLPLFAALQHNPDTRALAQSLYARVRPTYHPITAAGVDQIMQGAAR